MLFQLVEIELNDQNQVVVENATRPLFELREHAMAMAEFAASRCHGDYGYDCAHDWWWASCGPRTLRFVVREFPGLSLAA